MIEVTVSLQAKNGIFQAVLSYKEKEKWKTKWKTTKVKDVKGNKKKAEIQAEKIRGDFQKIINSKNITSEKILFIEYIKKWLNIIKTSVEETTYMGYKKLVYGRMTNYFNSNKIILQDIKAQDIQDFYQFLSNEGLSGNTVKHYHANIRKCLEYAVKTELIQSNPADRVEKPKINPYNAKHYTSEEILKLLNIVEGTKLETPVILSCFYGLRRSEVVGVKWSAIDFKNKTIKINHVVVVVTENGKNSLVMKDRTKTKASTRTLPLVPAVENYLIELKKKQEYNKQIFKSSYNEKYQEYVCVDEMGTLLNPDYVSHTFTKILDKNSLKQIRFHDLRHSCASMLLSNGINMKQIQAWLGHSNYNTTANTYAHLDCNSMRDSGIVISDILSNTKKEVEPINNTSSEIF